MNVFATLYAVLLYGFIFLPVWVLVLFSFQDSRLPIMPFKGPTLKSVSYTHLTLPTILLV